MIGTLELNQKRIGMHSCVIGALGPLLIKKMNRIVLNISIIRICSPKLFCKSGPFSPYKRPPNCSESLELNSIQLFSLSMVAFIVLVLGLSAKIRTLSKDLVDLQGLDY